MSLVAFKARNHPQQATSDRVDDRGTSPEFFAPLHAEHRFTIDAAANWRNALLPRYFAAPGTPPQCMWAVQGECGPSGCAGCPHGGIGPTGIDALVQSWRGERVWCNPPYSRLEPWVEKAWTEMVDGGCSLVVMLLPANRCEQGFWQRHVEPYRDGEPFHGVTLRTRFLPGRMRFKMPEGHQWDKRGDRPPFGCVLLTWERACSCRCLGAATAERDET